MGFDLVGYAQRIVILLIAITVHEVMHGFAAYVAGDTTAKDQGRLSLNPIKHLDPLGTIMMLVSSLAGVGIGWAKPVPVNPNYFKNPRRDMLIVALAGPFANFLLALIIARFVIFFGTAGLGEIAIIFLVTAVRQNVWLGLFNLIPIPPLDGSTIIPVLLPRRMMEAWWRFEQYGMLLLLGLVLIFPQVISIMLGYPADIIINLMFA